MIRKCSIKDLSWMVSLSHKKRAEYEKYQKNFWKMAKNSDILQKEWFESEINKDEVIALCFDDETAFVMGKIINPPEVYDAGLTLMIDDFCVKSPELWQNLGEKLLDEITAIAKQKGAKQIVIVCGDHDVSKFKFLEKKNLEVASRFYTKTI